jgi:hypothetical protein
MTGCGSSSGDSSSTAANTSEAKAPPLTKAQFIKRGDAICAKADKEQSAKVAIFVKGHLKAQSSKAAQNQMVLVAGLPPIQTEWEELAALSPPKHDEAKIEAIVNGIKAAAAKAEEKPESVLEFPTPFAQVDKLAGKYGFKVCSEAL